MDFAIDIATDGTAGGQMTFNQTEDNNLLNNIYLSLMTRRGTFFQNQEFGSRLHLLKKNTARAEALAVGYCREALQWLIDIGRATAVDIETERDTAEDLHRLKIKVAVTKADGGTVTFQTFVEVI